MTGFLDDLRRDGVAVAPELLPADQVDALASHLKRSACVDDHVFERGRHHAIADQVWGNEDWPVLGFENHLVVTAPHYVSWALSGYPTAAAILGGDPVIYSTSAFVTQPSPRHYRDTHDWHRDRENPNMLVMFMYGTDVQAPEDGAHLYEAGSHSDVDRGENYNGYHPTRPLKTVIGLAGTTFFIDPRGIHMGQRPDAKPRMLVWARWCAGSCIDGAQGPVPRAMIASEWPQDERLQRALRLVVA